MSLFNTYSDISVWSWGICPGVSTEGDKKSRFGMNFLHFVHYFSRMPLLKNKLSTYMIT